MKKHLLTFGLQLILIAACFGQVKGKKTLAELTDGNPAWNVILQMKSAARNQIEILPKEQNRADSALVESQLPTSSLVGAMIYESGGILIDKGWIRILGSGHSRLDRSVPSWNRGKTPARNKANYSFLLIADDVMGGFFALKTTDNTKLDSCKVYYFGPNSLRWRAVGLNYRTFLAYCFSGNIQRFYNDFRWTGWQQEVQSVDGNHAISCFPLLWTREGLELKSNRKVVTIQKVWENYPLQTKFLAEAN